ELAADFPHESFYQQEVAYTCWALLGRSLATAAGRTADAEQAYRQGLAAHEKLVADFPTQNPEIRRRLAANYSDLTRLLRMSDQPLEAMNVCQRAVDFYEKLQMEHPNQPDIALGLARCHAQMGEMLAVSNRAADADSAFRQAREQLQQAIEAYRH